MRSAISACGTTSGQIPVSCSPRNMAPSRVTAEDIVEFTLDGEAVNAAGRKVYLERFIHAEIFPQAT